jgi:hypothetical protein
MGSGGGGRKQIDQNGPDTCKIVHHVAIGKSHNFVTLTSQRRIADRIVALRLLGSVGVSVNLDYQLCPM